MFEGNGHAHNCSLRGRTECELPHYHLSVEERQNCESCGSPAAAMHEVPGGVVWLCPSCAAEADMGCP